MKQTNACPPCRSTAVWWSVRRTWLQPAASCQRSPAATSSAFSEQSSRSESRLEVTGRLSSKAEHHHRPQLWDDGSGLWKAGWEGGVRGGWILFSNDWPFNEMFQYNLVSALNRVIGPFQQGGFSFERRPSCSVWTLRKCVLLFSDSTVDTRIKCRWTYHWIFGS